MQTGSKILFVVAVIFLTRLLSSCDNRAYETQKIYYDFDSLTVQNLNNSGEYWRLSTTDEMDSETVAFRLNLLSKDLVKSGYQYAKNHKQESVMGFMATTARSPVLPIMIANQTIKKITIIALRDISEEIKSGTDVTGLFLLGSGWDLYSPIDTVYDNPISSYAAHSNSLNFILKEPVKTAEIKFRFIVELSDNTILSVETNLIKINLL
ncbi:MAG: hypothetical protein ACK5KP_08440 [Paludibacteraceae bacterium]